MAWSVPSRQRRPDWVLDGVGIEDVGTRAEHSVQLTLGVAWARPLHPPAQHGSRSLQGCPGWAPAAQGFSPVTKGASSSRSSDSKHWDRSSALVSVLVTHGDCTPGGQARRRHLPLQSRLLPPIPAVRKPAPHFYYLPFILLLTHTLGSHVRVTLALCLIYIS